MVNIDALVAALPHTTLEPPTVVRIEGLTTRLGSEWWAGAIEFLEPPGGLKEPYLDVADTLKSLIHRPGMSRDEGIAAAQPWIQACRAATADAHWVVFLDRYVMAGRHALPVKVFAAWLSTTTLVTSHQVAFLMAAAEACTTTPYVAHFDRTPQGEFSRTVLTLETAPSQPMPGAMIEFLPVFPWADEADAFRDDPDIHNSPFGIWRESMRSVSAHLEQQLGEQVFHFADLDCDTDDDEAHRFLVLHWCCHFGPETPFVQFLLRRSGASHVNELKDALISPKSYRPFKNVGAWSRYDEFRTVLRYSEPCRRRKILIAHAGAHITDRLINEIQIQVGADVLLLASDDVLRSERLASAVPKGGSLQLRTIGSGVDVRMAGLLNQRDELFVLDYESSKSGDDRIPALHQQLISTALNLGLEVTCRNATGWLNDAKSLVPNLNNTHAKV